LYAGRGGKPVMVVLMGPPGSGKSTFAEAVIAGSAAGRPWVRVCQVDPSPLSAFPFINLLSESVVCTKRCAIKHDSTTRSLNLDVSRQRAA
jgi:energy-coupling factor transporter ATP-binding protein EcfA2